MNPETLHISLKQLYPLRLLLEGNNLDRRRHSGNIYSHPTGAAADVIECTSFEESQLTEDHFSYLFLGDRHMLLT